MIDPQLLMFFKETYVQEPLEKTGFDGNLWKWEYPDYNKSYMVVADVERETLQIFLLVMYLMLKDITSG